MRALAPEIVKKYGTNDPFEVAKQNHILIVKEPLGNIYGYYNDAFDQKFIHINDDLMEYLQKYVAAHLLYRAFTSPHEMLFIKKKLATHFTDTEARANMFALNFLISNEELENNTVWELFSKYGVSKEEASDLFERLYRLWDPKHEMSQEELFYHVLVRTR